MKYSKPLLLINILIIMCIQLTYAEQSKTALSSDEIATKVVKTAGYGTEFIISSIVTYLGLDMIAGGSIRLGHHEFFFDENALEHKAFILFFGSPTVFSFGHSAYGLYKELGPIARRLAEKIGHTIKPTTSAGQA